MIINDSPTPAIDSEPTENSTNLVTSGGVYEALGNVGGGFKMYGDLTYTTEDVALTGTFNFTRASSYGHYATINSLGYYTSPSSVYTSPIYAVTDSGELISFSSKSSGYSGVYSAESSGLIQYYSKEINSAWSNALVGKYILLNGDNALSNTWIGWFKTSKISPTTPAYLVGMGVHVSIAAEPNYSYPYITRDSTIGYDPYTIKPRTLYRITGISPIDVTFINDEDEPEITVPNVTALSNSSTKSTTDAIKLWSLPEKAFEVEAVSKIFL